MRDAPIRESDEVRPGVIADFDEAGGVVRGDGVGWTMEVQER